MIENKEKSEQDQLISEDQSNLTVQSCDIIKKEKRRPFFIESTCSADRQIGFNVSQAFASARRASAHSSTGSLMDVRFLVTVSLCCLSCQ